MKSIIGIGILAGLMTIGILAQAEEKVANPTKSVIDKRNTILAEIIEE